MHRIYCGILKMQQATSFMVSKQYVHFSLLFAFHTVVITVEDSKAALRTFDEYSHLMTLIDPSSIEEQLHTAGLLPTDHSTSVTTGLVMEKLLKHIRSCVELKGAEMFISFINVLHSDGQYGILGHHLFGKMVYTSV